MSRPKESVVGIGASLILVVLMLTSSLASIDLTELQEIKQIEDTNGRGSADQECCDSRHYSHLIDSASQDSDIQVLRNSSGGIFVVAIGEGNDHTAAPSIHGGDDDLDSGLYLYNLNGSNWDKQKIDSDHGVREFSAHIYPNGNLGIVYNKFHDTVNGELRYVVTDFNNKSILINQSITNTAYPRNIDVVVNYSPETSEYSLYIVWNDENNSNALMFTYGNYDSIGMNYQWITELIDNSSPDLRYPQIILSNNSNAYISYIAGGDVNVAFSESPHIMNSQWSIDTLTSFNWPNESREIEIGYDGDFLHLVYLSWHSPPSKQTATHAKINVSNGYDQGNWNFEILNLTNHPTSQNVKDLEINFGIEFNNISVFYSNQVAEICNNCGNTQEIVRDKFAVLTNGSFELSSSEEILATHNDSNGINSFSLIDDLDNLGNEYHLVYINYTESPVDRKIMYVTNLDSDDDGVSDSFDLCHGFDDAIDTDGDDFPDACADSDGDGVIDDEDNCPGTYGVNDDVDEDGCADYQKDSDGDGFSDSEDLCEGYDDLLDTDNDGIPDGCDTLTDSDNDGFSDSEDLCEGYDDLLDTDNDGIPDGCDTLTDSDNDGFSDSEDLCEGYDDLLDTDNDGIPDGCDTLTDSDNDGFSDSEDLCEGYDDLLDTDNDGIPDGCDTVNDDESNNSNNNANMTNLECILYVSLISDTRTCSISDGDLDWDGILDIEDDDQDGDGYPDFLEYIDSVSDPLDQNSGDISVTENPNLDMIHSVHITSTETGFSMNVDYKLDYAMTMLHFALVTQTDEDGNQIDPLDIDYNINSDSEKDRFEQQLCNQPYPTSPEISINNWLSGYTHNVDINAISWSCEWENRRSIDYMEFMMMQASPDADEIFTNREVLRYSADITVSSSGSYEVNIPMYIAEMIDNEYDQMNWKIIVDDNQPILFYPTNESAQITFSVVLSETTEPESNNSDSQPSTNQITPSNSNGWVLIIDVEEGSFDCSGINVLDVWERNGLTGNQEFSLVDGGVAISCLGNFESVTEPDPSACLYLFRDGIQTDKDCDSSLIGAIVSVDNNKEQLEDLENDLDNDVENSLNEIDEALDEALELLILILIILTPIYLVVIVVKKRREAAEEMELEDDYDSFVDSFSTPNQSFTTIKERGKNYNNYENNNLNSTSQTPPFSFQGEINEDGWEICEYPRGSEIWWWKDYDTGTWALWE
ncbi:hypothetical protein N9K60_03605 [Candidatus Poseidoniales archaeon]|nr:hypothetical protein [Candidatus Poseidoniales archaeon]